MKKVLSFILLFVLIPILNVSALSCYETDSSKPLDLDKIINFPCSGVEGENLTFKYNGEDYSKYFKYENGMVNIIDKSLVFNTSEKVGIIIIGDEKSTVPIYIKNNSYIEPSTTTTTTTLQSNEITYTVTLDQNDGSEKIIKTCTVKKEGEICNVTLPKIEKDGFEGWGTAPSCKEGKIGSTRVDKDITYYACNKNNIEELNNNESEIYLKSLEILNSSNDEKIDFGVFSIKKREYEFKVLNEVESLKLNATADENITVNITGNENLVVGENEVVIELKDENNNISNYKLKVIRLNEGEVISNVHYLKKLVVGVYPINFNKEQFNYSVTIPSDIDKLVISAEVENENDKREILGNENLVNGSIVRIIVTGEDNKETEYTINIIKEASVNMWLLIAVGGIFVLIIILIILIIIKSKKNKKPKNNLKPETVKQETIETL